MKRQKKTQSVYISESKNLWGVKFFCPDEVEGEDELSLIEHSKRYLISTI